MVQLQENAALATVTEVWGPMTQQTPSAAQVHKQQVAAVVESATLLCAEYRQVLFADA